MKLPVNQLFILFPVIAALLSASPVAGQSDMNMSANWQSRSGINPASIACPGYLYLFTDAGRQWLDVEGAPRTFRVQASRYIDRLNTAFGFSLTGDAIGVTRAWNPMLSYAYRASLQKNRFISMGLSAGIFSRTINGTAFESDIDGDPAIPYETRRFIRPDVSAGIEYQSPRLVVGLASTHLLSIVKHDSLPVSSNHRYLSVVYRNTASDLVSWYLGMQLINRQALLIAEASACIRFRHPTGLLRGPTDLFEAGISVRSSRQMSLMFGLNLTPDLRIGYLFNQSFITGYYPNGSHEVMVEYRVRTGRVTSD